MPVATRSTTARAAKIAKEGQKKEVKNTTAADGDTEAQNIGPPGPSLLDLPPEIRLMIYELCWPPGSRDGWSLETSPNGLIHSCKTIQVEAAPYFFRQDVELGDYIEALKFLSSLAPSKQSYVQYLTLTMSWYESFAWRREPFILMISLVNLRVLTIGYQQFDKSDYAPYDGKRLADIVLENASPWLRAMAIRYRNCLAGLEILNLNEDRIFIESKPYWFNGSESWLTLRRQDSYAYKPLLKSKFDRHLRILVQAEADQKSWLSDDPAKDWANLEKLVGEPISEAIKERVKLRLSVSRRCLTYLRLLQTYEGEASS